MPENRLKKTREAYQDTDYVGGILIEDLKDIIQEIVDQSMEDHLGDYEHPSFDDISSSVEGALEEVYEVVGESIADALADHVNECGHISTSDLDESINDAIEAHEETFHSEE